MNMSHKIALITGGASGMGQACAETLKKQGAKVIVWDINDASKTNADLAFQVDITDAQQVESTLEKTIAQLGTPNILINCAGIAPAKKIVGRNGPMPLEDFKKVIDVNLVGSFNVMRVVAHAMSQLELTDQNEERGVIINTASIAAYEGQIGQAAYSASKGGLVALTLTAARELAQNAIRVNTIAPGLIGTPLLLNMPEEVQEKLANSVTFPKRLGKPEEFASLVIHVIENHMINGEVIRLDGALRMQAS